LVGDEQRKAMGRRRNLGGKRTAPEVGRDSSRRRGDKRERVSRGSRDGLSGRNCGMGSFSGNSTWEPRNAVSRGGTLVGMEIWGGGKASILARAGEGYAFEKTM